MAEGGGDALVAGLEREFKAGMKPNGERVIDNTDRELRSGNQSEEVPTVPRLEPCTENSVKEAVEHMELDPNNITPAVGVKNDAPLELQADGKEMETLQVVEGMTKEVYMDTGLELGPGSLTVKSSVDIESQHSNKKQGKEDQNDDSVFELNDVKQTKEALVHVESENGVKEASHEDVFSEVSNPNFSPRDASSHSIHNIPGGCGEVSSLCSRSSSEQESLGEGDHCENNGSGEASTSCVVLEIPKHVSTTGIRKITFKFSKRKENNEHTSSISHNQPLPNEVHDGFHEVYVPYASLDDYVGTGMHPNMDRNFFSDFASNRELKMSKKVVPDSYPTNVKKLLSTGILEGARVKYISIHGEVSYTFALYLYLFFCALP